jgi:hypothetical protein
VQLLPETLGNVVAIANGSTQSTNIPTVHLHLSTSIYKRLLSLL